MNAHEDAVTILLQIWDLCSKGCCSESELIDEMMRQPTEDHWHWVRELNENIDAVALLIDAQTERRPDAYYRPKIEI